MAVYPIPPFIIDNEVIVPPIPIDADIVAPDPTVDAILIIGDVLYPLPAPFRVIELIVPPADTETVAAAPIRGW